MEIKQKHGKHALRKAVTAAVLAGTAFSSLGGLSVFAHEKDKELVKKELKSIQEFVVNKAAERKIRTKSEEEILSEIKDFLSTLSSDTLEDLISQMDNGRLGYPHGKLHTYSGVLGTYRNNDRSDWRQNSISLISLVLKEIQNRIAENAKRGEELLEKNLNLLN